MFIAVNSIKHEWVWLENNNSKKHPRISGEIFKNTKACSCVTGQNAMGSAVPSCSLKLALISQLEGR